MVTQNPYNFSERNFIFLKNRIKKIAGIHLSDAKMELVCSRVSRVIRKYNLNNFDEFCSKLSKDAKLESDFVNAITTNYTSFMREDVHFDFLKYVILPYLIKKANSNGKRVRVWSAGCSSGEEPYSISFIMTPKMLEEKIDFKILATDIDSSIIDKAKLGVYRNILDELPSAYHQYIDDWFYHDKKQPNYYAVKAKYKDNVWFKNFNLATNGEWPMSGPFDVIFCRNVMIYFDRVTQIQLIENFCNLLASNGFLILGHSESVPSQLLPRLKYLERTIYRRTQ